MAVVRDTRAEHPPLVVIQPTSFCNLDCTYCYVEGREDITRMSATTVRRIAAHALAYFDEADVVFHAGEPLTAGLEWFEMAVDAFEREADRRGASIRLGVQTNGVLVDDKWIKLFLKHDFMVGVSLDGPAWIHDAVRPGKGGRGSHARSERGYLRLQEAGLRPTVLAVVTDLGLRRPDDLYDYFSALGVERVGLNVEDATAAHLSQLGGLDDPELLFQRFVERLIDRSRSDEASPVSFREVTQAARAILSAATLERPPDPDVQHPMRVVSYDVGGNFGTFCPELMTATAAIKTRFVLGNVLTTSMGQAASGPKLARLTDRVAAGALACEASCDFYMVCGGGKPSSKVFELDALHGTETLSCRLRVKAVARAVASRTHRPSTVP